jgi:pimeloyl-ACP methyl ester carboxylesterase
MTSTASATASQAHLWRSPQLGLPHRVKVDHGEIEYFRRGSGPAVVFAHGWGTNANLWRNVVPSLADHFTCFALDLPFGGHRAPVDKDADLTPDGCGRLIAGILDMLDLQDVTLVGNDSGGAYAQIAAALRPERVARLVLNSCETPYDPFPPEVFSALPVVARDPAALRAGYEALHDPAARLAPAAYGLLAKRQMDRAASDSYALPPSASSEVLRDVAKVMSGATSEPVHRAGQALIANFRKPVLFAWSAEDPVFPVDHARRYAKALADGRVALVQDAYSFTPEDQPGWLAATIAEFAGSN